MIYILRMKTAHNASHSICHHKQHIRCRALTVCQLVNFPDEHHRYHRQYHCSMHYPNLSYLHQMTIVNPPIILCIFSVMFFNKCKFRWVIFYQINYNTRAFKFYSITIASLDIVVNGWITWMLASGLLVLGFFISEFIQEELTVGTDISIGGTRCSSFHCFFFMHFLSTSYT